MATRETLGDIRKSVENCRGERVILKTDKGKRKAKEREGVIIDVFPSVFTVKIDDGMMAERTLSFSYSDILTETVEVTLVGQSEKIQVVEVELEVE